MSKTYAEKLLDPRWQKKRLEILERDEWMCQLCQDKESTLHVHHMRYFPRKDPWEYDNELLLTLCKDCHEEEKESRPGNERDLLEILKMQGFMSEDVNVIASGFLDMQHQYPPNVTAEIINATFCDEELFGKMCKEYFSRCERRNNEGA